jgi:hypothetical protein
MLQTPSHGWIYYFPLAKKAKQAKQLLWETSRVSENAKVESILQAMRSTTYSLLMNSSKACNKFHLSLHLSMLPKLALEVTDLVHGSHFFGDSNRQTLSICYAGSLEKIKLLGAIYWLTYWLNKTAPPGFVKSTCASNHTKKSQNKTSAKLEYPRFA